MSYKEKYDASQSKAYLKNIATKIDRDLSELRTQIETSPTAPRRWIWELIQNARDVYSNDGVRIIVEFRVQENNNAIVFKHTGLPFSADNIRFLIEQISSKDREKDGQGKRKSSGKFGTGFLTTHLLSEIVKVESIAKESNLEYKKFQLVLDRSGQDLESIIDAVEEASKSVENLDDLPSHSNYEEGEFNTSFHYPLDDQTRIEVAKKGLEDLGRCLPYALGFVPEINNLQVLPAQKAYQKTGSIMLDDLVEVSTITKNNQRSEIETFEIATISKNFTTIALPVHSSNGVIEILSIGDEVPRLFCDFPLVGTETFPFPIIINNPHFNPTEPRDGVLLTGDENPTPKVKENRAFLNEALELYFALLEYAAIKNWKNLYLLANIQSLRESHRWISKDWFNEQILKPIRGQLLKSSIVNTAFGGDPVAILKEDDSKFIWFPTSTKHEVREKIWELAKYWFPKQIPQKSDIEHWYKLSWNECGKLSVDQLAEFIEDKGNIQELAIVVEGRATIDWLNDFYEVLKKEDKDYDTIINNREIFPNQNGDFCKKGHLSHDRGDIDDDFKDILALLGNDIRGKLADQELNIDFAPDDTIDQSYVVRQISSEVNQKSVIRDLEENHHEAFSKLLLWFKRNPEKAETLFADIYKRKHILYDEEVIMDNMDKAEQLDDLITDYGVSSLAELRDLIQIGHSDKDQLLPVTQEIIASMGITSIEEWEKALQDKDLAALFDHESVPTTDMFVFAQSHINRAKENIIRHLETLSNYDISNLEETAQTVLAGILKDGREIQIVVRPAYNHEVIIYYQPELDVLDYVDSELWIDDGQSQRQISMGHVLRKADIKKFPI